MNKKLIIIGSVVIIIVIAIILLNVIKMESPTGAVVQDTTVTETQETVQETTQETKEEKPAEPVVLYLVKDQDINLGYMPKSLILKNLVQGVYIKLGTIELVTGPFSETSLLVALIGKNTNNIILTDDITSGYETSDGKLEFLYKVNIYSDGYTLYINRTTNPRNYPDSK